MKREIFNQYAEKVADVFGISSKDIFKKTKDQLDSEEYVEYKTPGKSFWIQPASQEFMSYVISELYKIERKNFFHPRASLACAVF